LLGLAASIPASLSAQAPAKGEKPAAKTRSVKAGELSITVPESWKQKTELRMFRVANFDVPASGEDKENGEFIVFYFDGGGGGIQENINRWIDDQFEPTGRKAKVFTGDSAAGKYTLVDTTGTYKKSVGPPMAKQFKPMPGWRVMNVYLESKPGPYFLRIEGPEKSITVVENDFRATFGGKKDAEKERPTK
jgi:hypothetical protein